MEDTLPQQVEKLWNRVIDLEKQVPPIHDRIELMRYDLIDAREVLYGSEKKGLLGLVMLMDRVEARLEVFHKIEEAVVGNGTRGVVGLVGEVRDMKIKIDELGRYLDRQKVTIVIIGTLLNSLIGIATLVALAARLLRGVP